MQLTYTQDFCVSGTASDKLFGVAEGLWEPDLVRMVWRYTLWVVLTHYAPAPPGTGGSVRDYFTNTTQCS
jgi:hypothetical protein